jgi:hypothetical protein
MVLAEAFRARRDPPLAHVEFATIRERLIEIRARPRGGDSLTTTASSSSAVPANLLGSLGSSCRRRLHRESFLIQRDWRERWRPLTSGVTAPLETHHGPET